MKWIVALSWLTLAGCTQEPPPAVRLLVDGYGCGSCHVIPRIPGATGRTGPPLENYHQQVYVAGVLPNTEEALTRFIMDPQAVDPRSAMPDLDVTADEASLLASYLREGS